MVAGPFLFAFQIGDGPITDASRGFDFFAGIWNRCSASRVISAGVRLQFRIGRLRSCSAEGFVHGTQSWMNFKTALKMRPGTSTAVPVQTAFWPSDLPVR